MTAVRIATMTETEAARVAAPVDEAGFGALRTERGNLPLDRLDVRAAITGLTVRVELTQDFRNTHDEPLEATYIFPLPDRAAVIGMRMTADDRVVEATLQERAAARQSYDTAIAAGQRASIAEEERPDVFTMRVGNILPGERVSVALTLAGPLSYADGEATFRFPLVVAPRYIPGDPLPGAVVGDGTVPDTDAVPDASRITPPVLLPGFPHPVKLAIEVAVDPAGLPLGAVRSSLHTVSEVDGVLRIQPGERADRDFVLRLGYGEPTESAALTVVPDAEGDEGSFELTVLPPEGSAAPHPRDLVLVLDRSGSMAGWKMVAARRAAARIVDTLTDADRFAVLAFDTVVEAPPGLPAGLVAGTDRHRFRAVEHLARMESRGGTELLAPLRQALDLLTAEAAGAGPAGAGPAHPVRDRVLVLVTDGQVGNEDQILAQTTDAMRAVRVHTVGIDQAVNAGFLGRLAAVGGGRCELVESEDRLDEAMDRIHRRIGSPLVTGVRLDAEDLSLLTGTRTPARLADLFPGVPYVVRGRYRGSAAGALVLRGTTRDGAPWSVRATGRRSSSAALTPVWARAHLRDLEDRYAAARGEGADPVTQERYIVDTSLRFGVLCRFTAFVAVDARVVTEGGSPRRIIQPVEPAAGWDMLAAGPMPPPAPMAFTARATSLGWRSADLFAAGGGATAAGTGSAAAGGMRQLAGKDRPRRTGFRPVAGTVAGPVAGATTAPGADQAGQLAALRELADREARRLREAAGQPGYQRRELLEDLASRLAALLVGAPAGAEPLRELVDALAPDRLAAGPIDELWAEALNRLTVFAGGSTSRGPAPDPAPGPVPAPSPGPAPTRPAPAGDGAPDRRRSFWKR